MTIKIGTTARTAMIQALVDEIGASGKMKIYSGAAPTNPGDAASGTLLVDMALPATPFGTVASGSVSKSGTWSGVGTAGAGAGTDAGYFRLTDSGDEVHYQGSITEAGGGGDAIADNSNIAEGQNVTVTALSITDGNT